MHRWSKTNQAPDAVGYMVALDRKMAGAPFSARKLAEYCGWTRWHASQIIGDVQAFLHQLDQPTVTAGYQPPQPSDFSQLGHQADHIPASNQPDSGHRGRDNKSTPTEQEQPQHITSQPIDLDQLWAQLEDIRLQAVPGTKRGTLGKRRDTLRIRVAEHGEEMVLHAWRWWWHSGDRRARYLRDEGYGMSTFLRASKMRDYVDHASNWNPDATAGQAWFTDEDFDEHGNIKQRKTHNGNEWK